mgnify:CR=1 FL=1
MRSDQNTQDDVQQVTLLRHVSDDPDTAMRNDDDDVHSEDAWNAAQERAERRDTESSASDTSTGTTRTRTRHFDRNAKSTQPREIARSKPKRGRRQPAVRGETLENLPPPSVDSSITSAPPMGARRRPNDEVTAPAHQINNDGCS